MVAEDAAAAADDRSAAMHAAWEERYAAADRVWSGRVNAAVAATVAGMAPGTALDIGSGEGGDVLWLAEHGWHATGLDVSPTAVRRAGELAAERGLTATFVVGDGAASIDGAFDLVLASFLHSWDPEFPRIRLLRDAADRVAPGGRLLVLSHAAPPPWSRHAHDDGVRLLTPEQELELLALDPSVWETELCEVRPREATGPDGQAATLEDGILLLRRSA
ncbi:class I SAM-dependent methyltransferase [Microbacterium sediminicola]|uniref:Class I SAM-dependent methyltransferase n=1 Tax=Microbacterium sediminicola TaxID=415210 RepID=A0ABN2I746_9MICO